MGRNTKNMRRLNRESGRTAGVAKVGNVLPVEGTVTKVAVELTFIQNA